MSSEKVPKNEIENQVPDILGMELEAVQERKKNAVVPATTDEQAASAGSSIEEHREEVAAVTPPVGDPPKQEIEDQIEAISNAETPEELEDIIYKYRDQGLIERWWVANFEEGIKLIKIIKSKKFEDIGNPLRVVNTLCRDIFSAEGDYSEDIIKIRKAIKDKYDQLAADARKELEAEANYKFYDSNTEIGKEFDPSKHTVGETARRPWREGDPPLTYGDKTILEVPAMGLSINGKVDTPALVVLASVEKPAGPEDGGVEKRVESISSAKTIEEFEKAITEFGREILESHIFTVENGIKLLKQIRAKEFDKINLNWLRSLLCIDIISIPKGKADEYYAEKKAILDKFNQLAEAGREQLEKEAGYEFYDAESEAGHEFNPHKDELRERRPWQEGDPEMRHGSKTILEVSRIGFRINGKLELPAAVVLPSVEEPPVEADADTKERISDQAAIKGEFSDGTKYHIQAGTRLTIYGEEAEILSINKVDDTKFSYTYKKGEKEVNSDPRTMSEWQAAFELIHEAGKLAIFNVDKSSEKQEVEIDLNDPNIKKVSDAFKSIIANNKDMLGKERVKIMDDEIVPNGKTAIDVVFATLDSYFQLAEPGGDRFREAVSRQEYLQPHDLENIVIGIFKRVIASKPELKSYLENRLYAFMKDGHDSSEAKEILILLGNRDEKLIESALDSGGADCAKRAMEALKEGKSEHVINAMERFSKTNHPVAVDFFKAAYEYFLKYEDGVDTDTLNQIFRLSVDYFKNCRHALSGSHYQVSAMSALSELNKLAHLAGRQIRSETINILTARPHDANNPITMLKEDLGIE